MLTPASDYAYTPSPATSIPYPPPHHSSERPKIFLHSPSIEYSHMPQPVQHALTPQPAPCPKFETEPLLMNVHNGQHFYQLPHMNTQLLHVSSDYEYANGSVVTPSSGRSSAKRSREDLNLKEKKRMLKLNDRITQLKDMLDDAGVQTKKNKQSILDNAAHYIDMLRNNLLIAKQKAERAEKQTEVFRRQAQHSVSGDKVVRSAFEKTTTPRLVVDLHMQTIKFNPAFVGFAGETEAVLQRQKALRSVLSPDAQKVEQLMAKVCETKQSASALVKMVAKNGHLVTVTLVAAVITDESGKAVYVEFSLIPVDTQLPRPRAEPHHEDEAETSTEEALTDKDEASLDH